MKKQITLLAAAGLVAASVSVSQAQTYYVAGDFQGASWSANASTNQMTGGPVRYDFTITGQTPGATNYIKVTDGTWANNWPSHALRVNYDATGSATIHFYPGTAGDGWKPAGDRVGYEDTGNLTWGMAGSFNGWDGTQVSLAPLGSGIYSNSISIPTAGTYGFKFQAPPGSWGNINFGADFGNGTDGGADGSLTTTASPQTLPVVLDLPHGRYLIGKTPVTNQVVFAVDMSAQILFGYFSHGSSVFVSGLFNNWAGTGAGALVLTNYPPYLGGSNTNIYYGTNTFVAPASSVSGGYKFTDNDPGQPSGNNGYEQLGSERSFSLLATNGLLLLPVVSFGNLPVSDYLAADTTVIFTVNMTNAQTGVTNFSPAYVFNPNTDHVYINGNFLNPGWIGQWDPAHLNAVEMANDPVGSGIYKFTAVVPKGHPIEIHYKHAMDWSANGTNLDNEAPSGKDYVRFIRSTATGTYELPLDTFGAQNVEPEFGQLAVEAKSGGTVPLSWLGRPGVYVQTRSDLTSGSWTDHIETDGTNWSAGVSSTNGLVSTTNWPAGSGRLFFRLIKP